MTSRDDLERETLRTQQMADQAWAMMDSVLPDIVRILESGTTSERDEKIVRMVMLSMAGFLNQRRADARSGDLDS